MGCGCSKTVKRNTAKQISKSPLTTKTINTNRNTGSTKPTVRRVIKRPMR